MIKLLDLWIINNVLLSTVDNGIEQSVLLEAVSKAISNSTDFFYAIFLN